VSNDAPVDLRSVFIMVRYYDNDLTDVLDNRGGDEPLPVGQKGHIRVGAPLYIKKYECIQYDVQIIGYPKNGIIYKKTYLTCKFD
jgi:hypothetical protein